ncbi:right-handed parallel beta-helix repeat-containing protein [Nocardioides mangrovi]|uniref:Right-handed parallel beta-helix repeat-containing protein n=1 Tax=Nocardioides mangrovi TaxID=2874580 RepID=A0ABS7UGQ9_9ACTN|nr:right-handed parallel beta-helix repeat-containing protein [Nocardioides mangrovi]MBZ5740223.1 right-handed parallel beta-helix repeat-containing protein [Nocardioides mangrovi]
MSEVTAAERGETLGRGWRNLIRVAAVLVLLAALVGVAWVREHDKDTEDQPAATSTAAAEPDEADPLAHAAQETRLLDQDDARLRKVSLGEATGISRVDGTVVLGARRTPYTLQDLIRVGAAERTSRTVVTLVQSVAVRRDASLVIMSPAGGTLRLASGPKGYTSLVSWGGGIALTGSADHHLTVVGWDTSTDAPDTTTDDGRPYIRVKDGGLGLAYVDLSHLGYWSGRTGGLSVTGSTDTTAVARLAHVTATDLHIGFYASGAQRVRANDFTVTSPQRHGVELTNRSQNIRLRGLTVKRPGEDGVAVSNGTAHVLIEHATITKAGSYGLDVDGSPLADGLNSAGYGIGNYSGLTVLSSTITGSAYGGARITAVDHVAIGGTTIRSAATALAIHGAATDVTIDDGSTVESEDGDGIWITDDVTDASVTDSTIAGDEVGVDIDQSQATVTGNDITVGTGHGVRLAGDGDATATVSDNQIDGRGSGAVSQAGAARLETGDGNGGDWTYRPEAVMWAERHSSAMPLLLVLVVPLVGLVFVLRRRRQQRELRRLFEESLVAQGHRAIATYRPPAPVVPEPVGGESAPEPVLVPDTPAELIEAAGSPVPPGSPVPTLPGVAERAFPTAKEFAVAAVTESGYSPAMVARVLHVPTSRVRDWVAVAANGLDQRPPV